MANTCLLNIQGKVVKATKWAAKGMRTSARSLLSTPGLRLACDILFTGLCPCASLTTFFTHLGEDRCIWALVPSSFPALPLQCCPGVTCPKTSTANWKLTEKHWIPIATHCNFYHPLVRFIMTQDQTETSLKDADNPRFQFWIPESHVAPDTSRQLSC